MSLFEAKRNDFSFSLVISRPKTKARLSNDGACLCWLTVSLLCGSAVFSYDISGQKQLPNVPLDQDKDDQDRDSSFHQLRANIPSYLQPICPYSLLMNTEDYNNMPKPRHRQLSHLLHLMGSSLDLFWMSIEQPSEAPWDDDGEEQPAPLLDTTPILISCRIPLPTDLLPSTPLQPTQTLTLNVCCHDTASNTSGRNVMDEA
ncbi:uncharacterized protein LOC121508768 [Cheilinus undulatus]|uniref:uncharacterized protein LOC121508768 n=1 Tax=Cheilinus undulatus TaxID=241271 RepID=UPI001BD3CF22|nr:uncharacterized protein LOC121508768 [Cheilinus undulatus]